MIKFTRDTTPKEGGSFKLGEIVELSPNSENRWLKRGAAIEWAEVKVEKPKPKPAKKRTAKNKGK